MNKNQYLTISFFVFIAMFFIPLLTTSGFGIHHESIYYGVRDGILAVMLFISIPLITLFAVLGFLEKKK